MASKQNRLTLRITGPDGRTRESTSEQESIILGSGVGAAVQLADPNVSQLHLMLKVEAAGVKAIDLGSEHGTRLGNQAVNQPMDLRSGDVLEVGSSRIEVFFNVEQPSAEDAAPSPTPAEPGNQVSAQAGPPGLRRREPGASRQQTLAGSQLGQQAAVSHVSGKPAAPLAAAPARNELETLPEIEVDVPAAEMGANGIDVERLPEGLRPRIEEAPTRAPNTPRSAPASAEREGRTPGHVTGKKGRAKARRMAALPNVVPLFGPARGEEAPTAERRVVQVALYWGDRLLGVQHYGERFPVTIGEGRDNEFNVYAPGAGKRFVLARSTKEGLELTLPPDAGLEVLDRRGGAGLEALERAGRITGDAETRKLTLGLDERATVDVGNVTFLVRYVAPSAQVPVKQLRDRDGGFAWLAGSVIAAGVAFFTLITLSAPKDSRVPTTDDEGKQHLIKMVMKQEDRSRELQRRMAAQKVEEEKKEEASGAEEGAKAKGDEGKFGKKEAKKEAAAASKKGSKVVKKDVKEKARKTVDEVGLLGALGGGKDGASDVLGPNGLGSGLNEKMGGLRSGEGTARGDGGLATRGDGPGAGGTGLGIGGLGTQGEGRGTGGSGVELGGKGKGTVRVIPGQTTVEGGLPRDVIAKVIKRHENEIKYCYEAQRAQIPDLAGKVGVHFVIGPDGRVQTASVNESTLNNAAVERCMTTRIKRWKFPEPKGNGVVDVTFPWLFKPAGA